MFNRQNLRFNKVKQSFLLNFSNNKKLNIRSYANKNNLMHQIQMKSHQKLTINHKVYTNHHKNKENHRACFELENITAHLLLKTGVRKGEGWLDLVICFNFMKIYIKFYYFNCDLSDTW